MKFVSLKPKWGIIAETSIDEALSQDTGFWRNLGYKHDLILFKGLNKISKSQYYRLISNFGRPWTSEEYKYSKEVVNTFNEDGITGCLSQFSNKNSRLGNIEMPWHADIPNSGDASFPWRSLYIVQNPNPNGGLTSWLNITLDAIEPADEELELYRKISVQNQSWLQVNGTEFVTQPYIKIDPITQKKSLRSNYFVSADMGKTAWIKNTYIDGVEVDNMKTLGPIHKALSSRNDLIYTHQWELYDLIIYNNHSFMHRRTALALGETEEREFIRANIHHVFL